MAAKGKGHKGHRSAVKRPYYEKFRARYELKKIARKGKRLANIAKAKARREAESLVGAGG